VDPALGAGWRAAGLDAHVSLAGLELDRTDAPYRRLADALNIEHAASLRMQVHRHRWQVFSLTLLS